MVASSTAGAGEAEEVAAEAALSQCERNPLCTRGYRHSGRGGLCSVPHGAEEDDEVGKAARRTASAEGLALEKSDNSSGYLGVYPVASRFTSSFRSCGGQIE